MFLKSLQLLNFKNYSEISLQWSEQVNCLTGNNGSGKTNILDAIHYLCMCRSYFTASDVQNIKKGESFFMIQGEFSNAAAVDTVNCVLKTGQKKQFRKNGKEYDRLSDHIGSFPVVMVVPSDQELITGGSEERRKFIDRVISQTDKAYLENLVSYYRILEHRNAYLKQMPQSGRYDEASMQVWNEQLVMYGNLIFEKRKVFIGEFLPAFSKYYEYITGATETAALTFDSQLHETPFDHLLQKAFSRDRVMQFTTAGIHKDDLSFSINDLLAKKYGSQGQQKSFAMALKLAQFEYVKSKKNIKPIVMLDDLFDKLDDSRVSRILNLVHEHSFGQLFITDTHPERVKLILNEFDIPFTSFAVKNENVTKE